MKTRLFVLNGCPHCQAARTFLLDRNAVFVEIEVSSDPEARRALLTLTGRAEVPALVAGYEAVVGFNPETWARALDHAAAVEKLDPYGLPASLGEDPYKEA